jgi:hypothetical protein
MVVAASMEAGRKMDWKAYANLVHPDSLGDYRKMWLPVLQAAAKAGPDKQADLLPLFAGAKNLKSVLALKPMELFVCSMKGMASQFPAPKAGPLNVEEKALGVVREGGDLAHVVVRTRTKHGGREVTKVEVISLKRSGTEWKVLLPDAVREVADTFRRTLQKGAAKTGPLADCAGPGN